MYNNIEPRVRIAIGVFAVVFISLVSWYVVTQISRIGKIAVDIETAPENTSIKINGKNAHTGTNYLKEGTYTFTASKSGYDPATQKVTITKVNNYVALIPNPVSTEAIKEAKSIDVATRAETISGIAAETAGAALQDSNPIIKKLPYSDISGPFKIDFGYDQDDQSKVYLIVSFSTPDGRQKAIKWLKSNGLNITTTEIIFSDFSNPAIDGVDHD